MWGEAPQTGNLFLFLALLLSNFPLHFVDLPSRNGDIIIIIIIVVVVAVASFVDSHRLLLGLSFNHGRQREQ